MNEATTESYKALETVLEDEVKIYRTLLDLVRREKEVLISAKIDDLNENNKSKELVIIKLKGLERIREKTAKEMAQKVEIGVN